MTKRRVFYSFHYKNDAWRASQVRNIGVVEGNQSISDNDWEEVKKGGDSAIRKWIDKQLESRSCVIVLIGEKTAGRKWINYEIEKAYNSGKGLFGIYIHNLKDSDGNQSEKGKNPFDNFTLDNGKKTLSEVVKTYNPPYATSTNVYNYIEENIQDWVEDAIEARK